MSLKAQIEAILFVTAKPIKAQAIARIVNSDVQAVRQALLELVHDYEERQGGLEIADDDGYSFQIKDQYASLMDEFMPVEMSAALIRTLSAIAIKQPILQSDIIRIRGAGAYEHIKELVAKDLVAKKEESGERSPQLTTTKKFQEYFRLTKDGKDLRNYLKKAVKKANAAEAEAAAGQLAIPSMVPVEAEDQLNTGIFLETADMSGVDDAVDTTMESAMDVVASGDDLTHEEPIERFPAPPAVAAEIDGSSPPQTATENIVVDRSEGNDEAQPNSVNAVQPVAGEPTPTEQPVAVERTPTVQPVAAEGIATAQPAAAEQVATEQPVGKNDDQAAASTLSKLAKAATSREPEPLAAPDLDAAAADDQIDGNESNTPGTRKSTIQASMASKKEPGMATGKKSKPIPDKLTELLRKQKLLERQLKRGALDGLDGDILDQPIVSSSDAARPATEPGNLI